MLRAALLLVGLVGVGILLRPLAWAPGGGWPVRAPVVLERRSATSTVLVLGLDRRGTEVARTDTILLARVGPGRPPTVLSIPRDLLVQIPERGEDRINTAFVWGEIGGGNGASLVKKTVEEAFGVRVDRVAVVDFSCFQAAVDAAGGVTIDVPRRLLDEAYPTASGGVTTIVFDSGRQTIDGARALQYVRTRAPDSDFGRIRRQQQVISAIIDRLHSPAVAVQIAHAVIARCPDSGTEVSLADIALFGAVGAASGAPRFQVLDESTVTPLTLPSGAQVLQPRWDRIRAVVADLFGASQPARVI